MKRLLILLGLCMCLVAGCGVTSPPRTKQADPQKPVPATTMLGVLAERAEASPSRYETTDDLQRVVNKLAEAGDITQPQADAVKSKLGTTRRPLTKQDLDGIRGL